MELHTAARDQRIPVADALRGFALLGILVANIPYPGDKDLFFHLFIDKKFITIFSMLFGFGFYMQLQRAKEKQVAFAPYYFKRMTVLLIIGCIHAYVFWYGDIIRDYAICGMFLLLVHRWPAKRLLAVGILFNVVLTALVFILNGALGLQYSYDPAIVRQLPVATSYWDYIIINNTIDPFVNFLQDSPLTLVFCFGNMLFGCWLAKIGFFQAPAKFNRLRNVLMIIGATAGITASYAFILVAQGRIELSPSLLWLPLLIVAGMVLQSLFYISGFIKLFHSKAGGRLLSVFVPIGGMALTNYLLQTVFYLLLFFHWTNGWQLYGKVTLGQTWLIALVLFMLQALFSRWWLKKYQQGPVEYLWKNSKTMIKKAVITMLPLLFSLGALAQWEVNAGAGTALPITGYKQVLKPGWLLTAEGKYRTGKGNFAIGMKTQFTRLQKDNNPTDAFRNARMTIAPLLFVAEYSVPVKGSIQPYVSGGLGITLFNLNYDISPTEGKTVFNVSFTMMPQAGLRYAATKSVFPFFEATVILLADGPPVGFPEGGKMTGYTAVAAGISYRFN